jgi:hypothetical protein
MLNRITGKIIEGFILSCWSMFALLSVNSAKNPFSPICHSRLERESRPHCYSGGSPDLSGRPKNIRGGHLSRHSRPDLSRMSETNRDRESSTIAMYSLRKQLIIVTVQSLPLFKGGDRGILAYFSRATFSPCALYLPGLQY